MVRYMLARAVGSNESDCMERETYVRPEVEVIDVRVERGFAVSVESEVEGFDREEWNE